MYVDDIKLAGKKQNINPMWKLLNKEVDLGEPTSFLDHVYLGCSQRQCEISKDVVDNYRATFESRISAGATEKLPCPENLSISSWSYDMEGHAKKCVERYCVLTNKTTQQLYKVCTPCIDDHHFKEEETKSVGELSSTCSQIVLKCLYLARIGRPDIQWSVNKLAQLITKWTKACDKRLNRLISYIHYTCEYKPHQRSPNAPKFEDRSREETEWQELGAREAAWKLAKNVFKLKEHERAAFFSSPENRCHLASSLKPEEREFVVDSGASMHMISKKDLSEAEMDTLTKSCSPTIVITANGEVQTHEERIVYVKELDMFLTMKVLENTPAVLSLGKLCDENGYSYEWINGQKTTSH